MSYYSSSSNRVRSLWHTFVKTSTGSRTATEHKIRAATAKADEADKAGIARDIQEESFRQLRSKWQTLLVKESLSNADWIDITEEEREAVNTILGEVDDDHDGYPSSSSTSPQIPPPNQIHPVAPSFSNSTRSANTSASSYAFVSPNELYSEDDGDPFIDMSPLMASSNDTSDEDEVMVQPVRFYPGRGGGQNGWSSSESLGASLHNNSMESSPDIPLSRPLMPGFAQNTYYGRMSSAKQSAAASASASAASLLQSDKERSTSAPPPAVAAGSKSKTARQPYIGPHLEDPNEPISEAEDFERFKMQTRMEKIVEFHQAAALAEIRLSFAIYRSRKASAQAPNGGERLEVSPLVLDHQKSMAQLQTAKEEERKTIVKTERSKRRSELRGRPGRSNTLVASAPGVPLSTNPSWMNGLEGQASAQLGPQFDINTLISQDPNVQQQEDSVQHMFEQYFPESSSGANDVPSASSSQYSSTSGHAHARSAFQPSKGFSSASMQSGVSGPKTQSSHKRRPSDVRVKKPTKGKGRPSLFGDDDSSDDDDPADDDDDDNDNDEEEEEEESQPTARYPFMDAHASELLGNQLENDFELQMTMAQYGLLPDVKPTPPPPPARMQTWSPGSRLMEQQPLPPQPVAPSPSPWMSAAAAAKEVRSTPTPSGWRKNTIVPTPTPQPTVPSSSTSAFRNPFGMGAQAPSPPPLPPSTMPGMMSAKAKGKQAMNASASASATPEPQPIWGQPHKRPSPPIPAELAVTPEPQPIWGQPHKKASTPIPAEAPAIPPQIEKPSTPAPTPAPAASAASKKANKKQRQAAKKGGAAAAATSSNMVEEPESRPVPPQISSYAEDPSEVMEPATNESSMFSSSISRMVPGMARTRMDSSAGFGFASWDASGAGGDSLSTPRPASKIPSHLQHLQQQQQEPFLVSSDTPRQNPNKKNPMVELFGMPLNKTAMEQLATAGNSSTIRARGSAASSAANANAQASAPKSSLFNMFASEPASVSKPAQDPRIPGGFDGGNVGGDDGGWGDDVGWGDDDGGGGGGSAEVEEPTQSFWQPPKPTTNSKAAQKSTAQGLRRMSEAQAPSPSPSAPPVPTPPAPTPIPPVPIAKLATPASQLQAAAANKKGKGKKGKGKKVTIEEVPDEEDKNTVEHLPVDSKVILEGPDSSPNLHEHHLERLESSIGGGSSSFGDEDRSEERGSAFGTAPSTAGSSQSDLFGGGSEQGWGTGGGGGTGFGWGSAKPVWGQGAATDNESQGSIWNRGSQSKQQTPIWGQTNNSKDKGKGKMGETEQQQQGSNKIVNPTIQNLKRKPVAGGKLF